MGCDIHCFAEVHREGAWEKVGDLFPVDEYDRQWKKKSHGDEPFDWRNYGMYGFLADVRNYSAIRPLSAPKGLPADTSAPVRAEYEKWDSDAHSASWLSLAELLAPDYDAEIWNRRYTRQEGPNFFNGGATATIAETHLGTRESLRQFLGDRFFVDLEILKTLGSPETVRIVFWFDN